MNEIETARALFARTRTAKDPTAYLRRESRAEHRPGENRDRDNRRAVVDYMLARGAFTEWRIGTSRTGQSGGIPIHLSTERVNRERHTHREPRLLLCIRMEPPPGAEWSRQNLRPRAVELYERRTAYNNPKRGRPRPIGERYELAETVEIPHWDYSGAATVDVEIFRAIPAIPLDN